MERTLEQSLVSDYSSASIFSGVLTFQRCTVLNGRIHFIKWSTFFSPALANVGFLSKAEVFLWMSVSPNCAIGKVTQVFDAALSTCTIRWNGAHFGAFSTAWIRIQETHLCVLHWIIVSLSVEACSTRHRHWKISSKRGCCKADLGFSSWDQSCAFNC